jgi:hypothetical protein
MKILLVSYLFPPDISPRAFRWKAISQQWAELGHHVDVVTNWKCDLSNKEVLGNLRVYRVGFSILEQLRYKQQQSCSPEALMAGEFRRSKFSTVLKWIHDFTWKKVYWPDYACLWYFYALRKAEELYELEFYEYLITVSLPFTAHLTGVSLKRRHQSIKWIADMGDPFCFTETPMNNQFFFKHLNYKGDETVFKEANYVVVTVDKCREKYTEIFPSEAEKIVVIPPISRIVRNDHINKSQVFEKNKLILLYAGNLYRNIRNPSYLLMLLSALLQNHPEFHDKIEMHFFGNIKEYQLDFNNFNKQYNILRMHGIVPHHIIRLAEAEADVLVNIGNQTDYQLPSKIVEYAGTGKPIINIYSTENDSSYIFLKQYPLAYQVSTQGHSAVEHIFSLSQFLNENAGKVVDSTSLRIFLQPYDVSNISLQYLNLCVNA